MCQKNQTGKSEKNEKNKKWKISGMGCGICEEPTCYVLWDKGYDKYSNNNTA